jgi:NitT/TauT family transport system permease protein
VPTPLSVAEQMVSGLIEERELWLHIWTTLLEILAGYVVGCALALITAAIFSEFEPVEWTLYPLVAGIQSIPKVALAPILMVWFGFEIESKIILVGLICFFPTFVNAFTGFRGADPNLIDLYRAFGAGRWRIFFAVKLPSAAGHIFAGLEISVVLALIGAVFAELLSSRNGLGHVIAASASNFNVAMMFACAILLALIGIGLTQIIRQARRRLAFWEVRADRTASVIR